MNKIINSINIGQNQSIGINQQLKQAIKILQMSNIELDEYISDIEEQNPFLSRNRINNNAIDISALENIEYNKTGRQLLVEQIAFIPKHLYNIAINLINNLDECGYIYNNIIEDIVQNLNINKKLVTETLHYLQKYVEPKGLFARSLKECLTLQIKAKNINDINVNKFITNIDQISNFDIKQIAKSCQINSQQLNYVLTIIGQLDPKPGLKLLQQNNNDHMIPDVILKITNNEWHIEINEQAYPKIIIDQNYYKQINCKALSKDNKSFLQQKFNTAKWIERTVEQKIKTTILVANEIVKRQEHFFIHKTNLLHPLTLKDIATTLEMHESTISRVVNNKYIATQNGNFALKYFFNQQINNQSSLYIKQTIKKIINKEDITAPISDSELVKLLEKNNIKIARRTVTKYRESLNLPSVSLRKKFYNLNKKCI